MIVNPPYKRKRLSNLTTYLYIYETDSWTVNDTPIFSYSPMCYSPTSSGTYTMEDSTTIVVVNSKIVA